MRQESWTAVDDYIGGLLVRPDSALDSALQASTDAGLPAIQVTPLQGTLLHVLARAIGAGRILEIGTLGGYSTIWLGRALSAGGRLVSLEVDPAHATVARANIDRAALADRVEVRVGRALDVLAGMVSEGEPPFDLVFIDADKPNNPGYFAWSLRLARPGTLIVVDNVVRGGAIVDAATDDPSVVGTRRLFDALGAEPGVVATAVQTVGAKGHDGFAVALVTADDSGYSRKSAGTP